MILETLVTTVACLGFAIIFNIKGKKIIFAGLCGGLSWFVYLLALKFNCSEIFAFFLSAICFSIYSEIFARILKTPVTTLIICGLIPLVPGAGMYNTMYEAITGNITASLTLALNTIGSAGSLALGVLFVSTITKLLGSYKYKKTNLHNKK